MGNGLKLSFFITLLISYMFVLTSCGDKSADIAILAQDDVFYQSTSLNNKVDILWVVDTSGSMAPYQDNLANNFSNFISDFVTKNYDYNMAVAGTDAWIREHNYNWSTCGSSNTEGNPNKTYYSSADCYSTLATYGDLTKFRDGDIYNGTIANGKRSGTYLLTSLMNPATVVSTFAKNIRVGIRGDGSERGFQSVRAVLRRNANGSVGYGGETHTELNNFRRSSAFLAIIHVADEEDQSTKGGPSAGSYSSTQDYVNNYKSFLNGYTNSTNDNKKYSVSSIVVQNLATCTGHHSSASKGERYMKIADETDGVTGSICDTNFSSKLEEISNRIVELSTRFQLSREPIVSSIEVKVDGVDIHQSPTNGWTYIHEGNNHFIEFHGSAIPSQGSAISVKFDPTTLN